MTATARANRLGVTRNNVYGKAGEGQFHRSPLALSAAAPNVSPIPGRKPPRTRLTARQEKPCREISDSGRSTR